jgi:type II secretory pathway pseudopilin PulG
MTTHKPKAGTRRFPGRRASFTLVEMLVAMAITLLMMAAVVTLFANVSGSVRNRRANVELTGQMRHVRNVLQQDLQGATCPGQTWQRPESNHGYIELIEGQYRDYNPSMLTDGNADSDGNGNPDVNGDGVDDPDEIDPNDSIIPRANDGSLVQRDAAGNVLSSVNALGDYDDILMLTTRNEHEPFVGRMPAGVRTSPTTAQPFRNWTEETIQSPLAEVVWFAIENPTEAERANNFFGEPGMRTIYRRTLLIAPWVNSYRFIPPSTGGTVTPVDTFRIGGQTFKAEPGLVRLFPEGISVDQAIAGVIAFQDRYDLSVRLEWDHNIQRWKIMANTLGDLTKRENRFGHYGYFQGSGASSPPRRIFPYPMVSWGSGYQGDNVAVVHDDEADPDGPDADAEVIAHLGAGDSVVSYRIGQPGTGYLTRPFVFLAEPCSVPSTANAIMNDFGAVVRVVHGPVPLWGERRGEDVMMTGALAFDLRIYDPGAPIYLETTTSTVLTPTDPGWGFAYDADVPNPDQIVDGTNAYNFVGQGAYVDMGYGFGRLIPRSFFGAASGTIPWFFSTPLNLECARLQYATSSTPIKAQDGGALRDVLANQLAPGYAVYDTWSFHYENNGVNDDGDEVENGIWQIIDGDNVGNPLIDEGTDGLDGPGHYPIASVTPATAADTRLGVDDVGERETVPPFDKPLRGLQVLMRVYEPDSRAIRQVRVNQHFMAE